MPPTLAAHYEEFLDDRAAGRHLRPSTLRAYRYELAAAATDERFTRALAGLSLADLEDWITRNAAAPSTISRRAATLRQFFAWAVRHRLCALNPLADSPPARAQRRLPRPIREQSEQEALDAAIATAPQPYRLIVTLLGETGMRAGEVLALRLDDVTLDRGREALRVREPKNGVERVVILGPTATLRTLRGLRILHKTWRRLPPHELVFRSPRGTGVSYDALHYQWAKICAAAGLADSAGVPRYTLHQLRHTRGSELLAQGQRVEIVQRVLGHRDIRSTLLYAELHDGQVRAALERGAPS